MESKRKKLFEIVLVAMALILVLVSCQSAAKPADAEQPEQTAQSGGLTLTADLQGKPWVNSNVFGNWPAQRPAPEDNFELCTNYELYMEALKEGLTSDSLYARSEAFQEAKIKELIADTSKTSDELELIRAYYRLFADFEKRNSEGNGPLLQYRDSIVKNDTVEQLSEEVQKGLVFGDPLAKFTISDALDGTGKYGVWIDFNLPLSANLSQDYTEEDLALVKDYLVSLLILAGYENDMLEMNLDGLKEFCTPLYDLVMGLGYYSCDGDPVTYTISNAGMFYGMEQMYMTDNIDVIEALYVIPMAQYAMRFIDIDTYAAAEMIEDPTEIDIEQVSYDFVNKYLAGAVDQVYLEFVFPEGLREKITYLTKLYIAAMEQRLKVEPWLSEETKQKALDKLSQMVCVVVYPDEWLDFHELSEIVKDHDQFLLDAVLCRDDFYRAYTTSFLGKDIERGNWVFSNTKTTEANAYYVTGENSINILAGILYDTLYYDQSIETVLASIGATIGHEITHGFDTGGAKYNGVGNEEDWWTEEDAERFAERAGKVADAMSSIEVADGVTVNGEFVIDEMVADLGGLALSLDIAKQYPDFDYDLFFRTYALMWYSIKPDFESALALYTDDSHPADYIRANFVVQMFDEFYSAYPQVKEGTSMYRAPEDRVAVW
ncbi:MAG: M13 family metallopeptidase [Spirochaetales bacterium]|nr:M13 family metallopeptidase [Spirochaetales bacterium]